MIIVDDNQTAESKLILLYILRALKMPITRKHFISFVLKGDFINYFFINHYIDGLCDNGFFEAVNDKYQLTAKGNDTLDFLIYKIPRYVRDKVEALIQKERNNIKREINVTADYEPGMKKDFVSFLKIYDNENPLLELAFSSGTKKDAIKICENFKKNADEIYNKITSILLDKE